MKAGKGESITKADIGWEIAGIVPVGKLGKLGKLVSFGDDVAKTGLTNAQLVQKAATKAEAAIGGIGRFAGTAKHKYATNLLDRYQSIYGHRGLYTNHYFNNNLTLGPGNRGILDVLDKTNGIIYDFKFGKAVMSAKQYNKYYNNFGLPIEIIRP